MLCPCKDEDLLIFQSHRYFLPHWSPLSALNLHAHAQGHALRAPLCCGVYTPLKISFGLNEWYTLASLSIYTALTGRRQRILLYG